MSHNHIGPNVTCRIATGMAALAAVVGSAGCAAQPHDCALVEVQCAGLVTDFGSVDEGLSHETWSALQDALSAGLLDRVDYVETIDTRDRQPNITSLAASGYDVIITPGAGTIQETLAVARDFPASYFIGVQQSPDAQPLPNNYATLEFHDEQAGFLAGAVAGLITDSGRVAAVCEVEFIDSVRETCDGFRRGAVYVNPAIRVDVSYRSGPEELLFRDHKWGAQTATMSIDRGADVVFAVGKETAVAALKAAAKRGALVIGAETDLYTSLPELRAGLVTSAVLDVRSGLLAMLQGTVAGQFRAGQHWGEVSLASFRDFDGRLPPETQSRLAEIADELRSGEIRLDPPQ